MSTPAEREARGLLISHGCCMEDYGFIGDAAVITEGRTEYERLLDAYRTAILASARERVEALHETFVREALSDDAAADLLRQLVNAGRNQMPLPTAIVYWKPFERHVAALDAAARAITEEI